MSGPSDWPEPVVRVQSLSDAGADTIPPRYVKPPEARPLRAPTIPGDASIPVIDLSGLDGDDKLRESTLRSLSEACRDWGFFQIVNHGVSHELMERAQEAWREFFRQPMEVKQAYANSPATYEGYGSRVGVEKGAILDWNDYYYLHYLPCSLRDFNKWPAIPTSLRDIIVEYSSEIVRLGGVLLKLMSKNLGLHQDFLRNAFGGDEIGACLRVNFYPKCPQPDLTFGLSPHSDPGGLTFLLPDPHVLGLQVRRNDGWVAVKPAPHAFIVNIGDQIQIMSNMIYKSVEHNVIVNSSQDRISLAYFYNPKGDMVVEPAQDLVTPETPAMYPPMTFNEYRIYIRTNGLKGKSQLGEAVKSIS